MMEQLRGAEWIWLPGALDDDKPNLTACFRREFDLGAAPESALLTLSAESRYVLHINGECIGQGPVRGWPQSKPCDTHEVSRFLRAGRNVLAIQVVRWGVACGYDVGGLPGALIARLDADGLAVVTDSTWRTTVHGGWSRTAPRLAYGHAFCEQYDARNAPGDWTACGYADSAWAGVRVVGRPGCEPWKELVPRTIPMLLEQRIYPRSVMDAVSVRLPRHAFMLNLFPAAMEVDPDPGFAYELSGVLVGEIVAERACRVTMTRMNTSFSLDAFDAMRLNGQDVAFHNDRAGLDLAAGSNLLTVRFAPHYQSYPSWIFESDTALEFHGPGMRGVSPFALYPCRALAGDAVAEQLWAAASAAALGDAADRLRAFRPEELLADEFALTNARTAIPQAAGAMLEQPHALCSDNAEHTIAAPAPGCGLEFLLDFGEETVGQLEFELWAPGGAVLVLNCFEGIRGEERVWTDNLNNTVRYVARRGWQRFRSVVRLGFRFAQVTIRDAAEPVRIRTIRCVKMTYPVNELGAFDCSDALLTRAWEMGRRTTQLCMEDTFVDCPAYEQTFWVGDCRNESLANFAAFGDTRLVKRCLSFAAESLFRSPIPEQCAPTHHAHLNLLPAWALFWVLACRELHDFEADDAFLREIYPSVAATCDAFLARRGDDGLMRFPGWNMLDWAPMDCLPGSATCHENAWLVRALGDAAALADTIGRAQEAARFREAAGPLRAAINLHLWDDAQQGYADSIRPDGTRSAVFSQQSQTVAYLCGCVPPERASAVERHMLNPPADWVRNRTPFIAWFSFEAFVKMGEHTTILDWMRRIWGRMARDGSTTCWEHIEATNDTSFRWNPTRSWCHAWSAAPTHFLSANQLGVQGTSPGWHTLRIAPQPAGLTWAKGRVPTPHGVVSVDWSVEDGVFSLNAVVPPQVQARVVAPEGFAPGRIRVTRRATSTVTRSEDPGT